MVSVLDNNISSGERKKREKERERGKERRGEEGRVGGREGGREGVKLVMYRMILPAG